jgi:hypothetical protein
LAAFVVSGAAGRISVPATRGAQATQGAPATQPSSSGEGRFHAELRTEGERFGNSCGFELKKVPGCASLLLTDHPLHVAVGSIAPQNGFGVGGALVTHFTPSENWRISWDTDAVGSIGSGAWRVGSYARFIATPIEPPRPVDHANASVVAGLSDFDHPVINVYGQAISLPTIFFFGLGSGSAPAGKSVFGFSQGIIGAAGTLPLWRKSAAGALRLTAGAEINERLPSIRSATFAGVPSIESAYSSTDAPGLDKQSSVTQFGESLRARPTLFNDHLAFDYSANWQQFVAADSAQSFRRWTVDLTHEVRLYGTSFPGAFQTAGPNECAADPKAPGCPQSHNRVGTITLRGLVSRSQVSGSSAVPFYFQQTLGGSDINGDRALAGFDDYRFRGSSVVLLQESLEHSLGRFPVGIFVEGDQGNAASQTQDIWSVHLRTSVAVGLNIRAGGFPVFTFAYGKANEGHHAIFVLSTTLLGGSSRPSLF